MPNRKPLPPIRKNEMPDDDKDKKPLEKRDQPGQDPIYGDATEA